MKRWTIRVMAGAVGLGVAATAAACGGRNEQATPPTVSKSASATSPTATKPPVSPTPQTRIGTWERLPAAPISARAYAPISVWTGNEMLIYGSYTTLDDPETTLGAAFNPASNTWRKLPAIPARGGGFEGHNVAVWTGTEMVVRGIVNAALNPATNTWRPLADAPAEAPPVPSVMVWTGSQVLIWGGGCCGGYDSSGAAYTPAKNSWEILPQSPLAGRYTAGAWTGKELILAGGHDAEGKVFADSAAYSPATRSWRRLPPLPEPRTAATAVWDGAEVLVVGGGGESERDPEDLYSDGVAYNPATNRWRRLPAMETSRIGHVAVWTGKQMLVWGGETLGEGGLVTPPHGVAYDPATDMWSPLPKSPLRGRIDATAVWTGTTMIVWGGISVGTDPVRRFADGAAYTPGTL
jgi:N-acetylneuraminic acid mutarotase